jgi:hypothetical protein
LGVHNGLSNAAEPRADREHFDVTELSQQKNSDRTNFRASSGTSKGARRDGAATLAEKRGRPTRGRVPHLTVIPASNLGVVQETSPAI